MKRNHSLDSNWFPLGISSDNGVRNGVSQATVYALAMNGTNNLFVGGQFTSVEGSSINANNIASWDVF